MSHVGPVTIGENVIVNEKAVVGIVGEGDEASAVGNTDKEVALGDNVTIESSAAVEASTIGEGSTIDVDARVGIGAMVGKVSSQMPSGDLHKF